HRCFRSPRQSSTDHWKPAPVVMVVLDELRGTSLMNDRRQIDAEWFPHFAELAHRSTWYRNATTVHHETRFAVPALLSGRLPSTPEAHWRTAWLKTLFSVLESAGFEEAIFEPVTRLATERMKASGVPQRPALFQAASIAPVLARVYLVHPAPTELQSVLP